MNGIDQQVEQAQDVAAFRMYAVLYGSRDHFGLHHQVTWEAAPSAKAARQQFKDKYPWNTIVQVRWDRDMTAKYRADFVDRAGADVQEAQEMDDDTLDERVESVLRSDGRYWSAVGIADMVDVDGERVEAALARLEAAGRVFHEVREFVTHNEIAWAKSW